MDADLDTPDQGCLIVVVVLIGRVPSSIDGFGKLHGGAVAFFWLRHIVASRLAGSGYDGPGLSPSLDLIWVLVFLILGFCPGLSPCLYFSGLDLGLCLYSASMKYSNSTMFKCCNKIKIFIIPYLLGLL
ncbi:hypothetical protein J1N35_023980 [Gossypium stocksii]|uniref:Uncharacterized protein n=1 Tax=Gossypium stocksii TaxID=47602 RepID=A0A9D4A4V1_9ROSI|nr:hypothetical protein J1N35_023980 [Gossypium stocksii]